MPVDPHNLATKPQLDITFLIKAGMAQWQTADVSRDLERPLAQGGPTIWQVRFFAQDDDPASKAFLPQAFGSTGRSVAATDQQIGFIRSEEHTSELQSLMRISYAVFCLKKKKHILLEHNEEHSREIRDV